MDGCILLSTIKIQPLVPIVPNKTLHKFKDICQYNYIMVLIKVVKTVEIFTNTMFNVNSQI